MKERIKKYYKENEIRIKFYTYGFVAGCVASYLINKIEGSKVDVAEVKSRNDETLRVRVLLTNGKESSWSLPIEK